jgi:hypothetical protein
MRAMLSFAHLFNHPMVLRSISRRAPGLRAESASIRNYIYISIS